VADCWFPRIWHPTFHLPGRSATAGWKVGCARPKMSWPPRQGKKNQRMAFHHKVELDQLDISILAADRLSTRDAINQDMLAAPGETHPIPALPRFPRARGREQGPSARPPWRYTCLADGAGHDQPCGPYRPYRSFWRQHCTRPRILGYAEVGARPQAAAPPSSGRALSETAARRRKME
jgi:hypothetical protein